MKWNRKRTSPPRTHALSEAIESYYPKGFRGRLGKPLHLHEVSSGYPQEKERLRPLLDDGEVCGTSGGGEPTGANLP